MVYSIIFTIYNLGKFDSTKDNPTVQIKFPIKNIKEWENEEGSPDKYRTY